MLEGLRNGWPAPPAALGFAVAFALATAGFAGRARWLKAVGLLAALATVRCWLELAPLPVELRGLNRATLAAGAGVLLLAAGWLFLAGRSAGDWLTGFALAGLAAAGLMFAAGAKILAGFALALHGLTWQFAAARQRTRLGDEEFPAMRWPERLLAPIALAGLLSILLLAPAPADTPLVPPRPQGWRELATRPTLPLAAAGTAAFAVLLAWRLRRETPRPAEQDA